MDSVSVTLLPSGLWILAQSLVILIMLVVLGYHLYFKQRSRALLSDAADVTDLAAKKQMLEAEKNELSRWLSEQNQNILKLKGEREEQERLRTEIGELKEECTQKEQELATIKNSLGDLGSRNYVQEQVFKNLLENVDKLEEKKGEIQRQLEPDYERYREIGVRIDDARDELSRVRSDIDDLTTRLNEKNQALEQTDITRNDLLLQTRLLENRKKELEIDVEESERTLHTVQTNIEVTQAELAGLKSKAASLNERLNEKTEALNKFQEKRDTLEIQTSLLDNRKQELQIDVQELGDKRNSTRAKFDEAWADLLTLRSETENLNTRRDEEQAAIERLTNKRDVLNQEISQIEQTKKRLEKDAKEARESLASIAGTIEKHKDNEADARHSLGAAVQSRLEKDFEIIKLSSEIERLEGKKIDKSRELNKLRKEMDECRVENEQQPGTNQLAIYEDLLRQSPWLDQHSFGGKPKEKDDEIALIIELQDRLKSRGLSFSDRVVKAFHTSLKCNSINPLTVLAGISGTGKTLLPVAYAGLMGMHSLVVAVQPRWDSPQDMFGFYNYLEKTYKATDLARALVGMDPYNFRDQHEGKIEDRMLLVLLDEMNLARTEYYFSEFLSKLELRRLVKDPALPENRLNSEIKLDTGPGGGDRFSNLWVGENVIFVGTMNEDESTQTLSDKVLDRSNVLRFGRPKGDMNITYEVDLRDVKTDGYLPAKTWHSWYRKSGDIFPWTDQTSKWLETLNDALEPIRRSFGYRVQESIRTYLANYPGAMEADTYKTAFADQLEQKIIPKLRGIDLHETSTAIALESIANILDEVGDADLSETFRKAREDRSTGMFIWPGVSR